MDIAEFCDQHRACEECRDWALANCASMAEVWERAKPEWLLWVATRAGVLDDRTLRLLACHFARHTPLGDGRTAWDLLADPRSREAVEVAERHAAGLASDGELAAAAWAAASAEAEAAASAACAAADACAAASAAAWATADAADAAEAAAWFASAAAWFAAAAASDAADAAWADHARAIRRISPNPFAVEA